MQSAPQQMPYSNSNCDKFPFWDNLTKEDLPCSKTCQRIPDKCHVLAKIQIVEGIKEVESFAFHGDGTGRDIKKILGNQLTLSTGEQFSMIS